jgi:hypothetical protein
LGEPFVDTPSSVIEKLLDRAAAIEKPIARATVPVEVSVLSPAETHTSDLPGVFLAPAIPENLLATVASRIALASLKGRLDGVTFDHLRGLLDGRTHFNCWAMTTASRGSFNKMRPGDIVLFSTTGTGRFTYRAIVRGKLESKLLGDLLWTITPREPWSLIYLLEEVRHIDLDKERLVSEFGYDRSFRVYGITRVQTERVRLAVERRGGLEAAFSAAVAPSESSD